MGRRLAERKLNCMFDDCGSVLIWNACERIHEPGMLLCDCAVASLFNALDVIWAVLIITVVFRAVSELPREGVRKIGRVRLCACDVDDLDAILSQPGRSAGKDIMIDHRSPREEMRLPLLDIGERAHIE